MALFAWGPHRPHPDEPSFTSGSILAPVLISVAVLSIVEIVVLHIIIGHWSRIGALVVTAIGMLVFVYMIGIAKSLKYMPTVLKPQTLVIRLGHLLTVEVPYAAIEMVRKAAPGAAGAKRLNLAPMSAPNLVIELAGDRQLMRFGRKRVFRQVALRMDDADSFEACLSDRLKSCLGNEQSEEKQAVPAARAS